MALSWMRGTIKEEKDDDLEIKPEDIKNGFAKVDSQGKTLEEIQSKMGILDEMKVFLQQQKADKEAARQAEADRIEAAKRKKIEENTPILDDDADAAVNAKLSPLVKEHRKLQATSRIREFLDEGEFEYYTGEVKKKMDALVRSSVEAGQNPTDEFLRNAYYVAKGQNDKDIQEGKIKSRFAAASSSSDGQGKTKSDDKGDKSMTEEEKRFARAFGLTEEEYTKNREEVNVGF